MTYKPSHISFSQIMTYLQCPEHYLFRYVLGIKSPPAKAMKRGKALHETLDHHFTQKKIDERGMNSNQAQDFYATQLETALQEYEQELEETKILVSRDFLKKEKEVSKAELLDAGTRGLAEYFMGKQQIIRVNGAKQTEEGRTASLESEVKPDLVEQEFILETNQDVSIKGYIDLTDTARIVHETKTSGKTPQIQDIARDPQLAIYNIGYEKLTGIKPAGFSKDFIISLKKEVKIQRYLISKPDIDKESILRYIWNILKAIQNDIWYCIHPANSWVCSADWCGYYKLHQELRKIGFEKMMEKYSRKNYAKETAKTIQTQKVEAISI